MDPRVRLDRRVPGQGLAEPPALARLWKREADDKPARILAGEKVALVQTRVRETRKVANPRPNAPLLKRIVRYPYRQECARPRHFPLVDTSFSREVYRSQPAEVRFARDLRYPIALGNPVRILQFDAVEPRVLPTVDEWLAGRR